jgi:hypothetical protein
MFIFVCIDVCFSVFIFVGIDVYDNNIFGLQSLYGEYDVWKYFLYMVTFGQGNRK